MNSKWSTSELAKKDLIKAYHTYLINKAYNESEWEIKKWAHKLKQIVCLLINCTMEQLEDQDFKSTPLGEKWWVYKINHYYDYDLLELTNTELVTTESEALKRYHSSAYATSPELIKTTPRILLELIGTDCFRDMIHPDIWINSLMSEYKISTTGMPDPCDCRGLCEAPDPLSLNCSKSGKDYKKSMQFPNWIITDTRFPNEIEAVKKRNGITIKVLRNPVKDRSYLHESETALDHYQDWDLILINDGTLEELIMKVKRFFNETKTF